MGEDELKRSKKVRWILVTIVFIFFSALIVGIQRDLPYVPDMDEPDHVIPAISMASSGDLNPHRFAHPASTTYYPLVVAFHVWNAVSHHGMLLHPDPNLQQTFNRNFWEFYILGRLLSIIYAVLSIPLIYLLGKEVFDEKVGVVGALFFSLYSLVVFYSRIVRTDSAALFFVMLSLWLLVKTYKKPTTWKYLLAGLSIGLSIASRYFMAMLIIALITVDVALLWQAKSQKKNVKLLLAQMTIGLSAVGVGFVLSTPYLFVSFGTFLHNIAFESRNTNPGFDGLSPLGNFKWYLFHAIPTIMSLPQVLFVIVGIFYSIKTKHFLQMMLLGFALVFTAFVSQFALHWYRWIIQILPILALFTAYGVSRSVSEISKRCPMFGNRKMQRIMTVAIIALLLIIPVQKVVALDLKASHYSTRIIALKWIQQNIPPETRIAFGEYSAPLENTKYKTFKAWSLAQAGYTLDDYREKYDYMVVSSSIYNRFFAEPDRYVDEIAFYQNLFEHEKLLYEVVPNWYLGGGTIRIFQLHQP